MRIELTEADLRYDEAAQQRAMAALRRVRQDVRRPVVAIPAAPARPVISPLTAPKSRWSNVVTFRDPSTWRTIYAEPIGPVERTGRDIMQVATKDYRWGRAPRAEFKSILAQVCVKRGERRADAVGPRRTANLTALRGEVFARLKAETAMTMSEMGEAMGGRDAATVCRAIQRYETLVACGRIDP